MNDRTRKRLIGYFLLLVLAVVIIPTFGNEDDPWTRYVNRYQTLITGIFAIGAAYFTIAAMQSSEERQERRHRQSLAVSVRYDRLAVLRLVRFIDTGLQRIEIELQDYAKMIEGKGTKNIARMKWVEGDSDVVQIGAFAAHNLFNVLQHFDTPRCQPLYTPELQQSLDRVRRAQQLLQQNLPQGIIFQADSADAVFSPPLWYTIVVQSRLLSLAKFTTDFYAVSRQWSQSFLEESE